MNLKRLLPFFLHAVILCLFSIAGARADLQMPSLFTEHMVLQQGTPVTIWGWAEDGEKVTVRFRGQKVVATTANKKWVATLRPLKAGGPDKLTVSTKDRTLEFDDVLVGEVWVCSGQSNMEWPLSRSFEPDKDIASATNEFIRLFKVPKNRTDSPTVLISSAWERLSPKSVESFSAVAYYFGRDLQTARRVPVGLIGTYWGGTPAEAWISRTGLEMNPRLRAEILETYPAAMKDYRQALAAFEQEKTQAAKDGREFNKRAPYEPWGGAQLYNGMIAPLAPFKVAGAIWYQGESNAGRADQYRVLFADMIRSWRRTFEIQNMPFLAVQLAPFKPVQDQPGESDWAELREAQLLATKVLPKVGLAVITDVGDPKDIHPTKKEPVGARLALAARAIAYGEKIEYCGPVYRAMKVEAGRAILSFDHAESGLEARGGELKGFAMCGADRKWVWANAEIVGNTVVVSSPQVALPVGVRYGWADCPVVNLWNKAGLPATPFRTDDFPLITAGK